jgi:hypothetical protein
MRICLVYLLLLSAFSIPTYANQLNEKVPDEQMLVDLEQRAAQAPAKDQCFLYSQLVHEMIEYSVRQYASGDTRKATEILKSTEPFTHKIRMALTGNPKRLKDTQILLRRTVFRLTDLLHASRYEDRPLIQKTLAQMDQTQDDAMIEMFKK